MMLIDSNLIIYAVQAEYKNLREWIIDNEPSYSIISRVEVLGFARLQPIQKQALSDLLNNLELRNRHKIISASVRQTFQVFKTWKVLIHEFISCSFLIYLNPSCYEIAIALKQQRLCR